MMTTLVALSLTMQEAMATGAIEMIYFFDNIPAPAPETSTGGQSNWPFNTHAESRSWSW